MTLTCTVASACCGDSTKGRLVVRAWKRWSWEGTQLMWVLNWSWVHLLGQMRTEHMGLHTPSAVHSPQSTLLCWLFPSPEAGFSGSSNSWVLSSLKTEGDTLWDLPGKISKVKIGSNSSWNLHCFCTILSTHTSRIFFCTFRCAFEWFADVEKPRSRWEKWRTLTNSKESVWFSPLL